MKKILLLGLFISVTLTSFEHQFKVVANGVTIKFKIYAEDTEGTIGGFQANIDFNVNDLASSKISGSVDASTINTENKTRDEHIISDEYLNVKKYPQISFESNSIVKDENDGNYKMLGKLNLIGVEKEISIIFSFAENVFTAKSYIFLKDFGFTDWKKREESKVKVFWKIKVE